jgi:pimeloyl-ACP methyl ester carboxylesterase
MPATSEFMDNRPPILLLPGMAADAGMFEPQRAAFPNLIAPSWIDPLPQESLRHYADRFAESLDPGRPCIVGGVSFGGIVALEMASRLRASACVLISSVRSPAEYPLLYRILRLTAVSSPSHLGWFAGCVAELSAPSLPPATTRRLQRLSSPRSAFLRWATWAALRWQPSPAARKVPVLQIHGDADRTFPIRHVRPDIVVQGGGHLLSLTHPAAVNDVLRRAESIAA